MAKTEHSVTALDEQTGSLAQVTDDPVTLLFHLVPIERHLVTQKLLHEVGHPPTRSQGAAVTLHPERQPRQEPAKFAGFKNDPVQWVTWPGLPFARFPRLQHHLNDLGVQINAPPRQGRIGVMQR